MTNLNELYEQLCNNLKVPVDDKIVKALKNAEHSGELNVSGMSVTTQTCEVLSKVLSQSKCISKLNLSDCLLPTQGLSTLLSTLHLTNINSLQLRGNNIGGPSVYKLSKMVSRSSNIKTLGLEWNNLGLCSEGMNQFCNGLAVNRSLEVLDLRNNQLDEECALLLAEALRKNISLRALDVRWNSMEQKGGQYFLSAVQLNKTLTTLKLQGNSISNDLLTAIEQCVKHNSDLLQLQSGYEARKEILAEHVRAVNSQRAEELRQWADKSQQQVIEMDARMKEVQGQLVSKLKEVEDLQRVASEGSIGLKAALGQVRNLEEELKLKDESHAAAVRDYQLQLETLNKALAANKASLSDVDIKLAKEIELREAVERERENFKENIKQLEDEINRRKEELQRTITDQIAAIEQERRQAEQRLTLVQEEWRVRLEQKEADYGRAEQVWRDRLRSLEAAMAAADARQAEWAAERARWAEEKASIWVEAKEKESCKVLVLTEKMDHLKEEKSSLEAQLSIANMTTQQLQRDNSTVVADLTEMRRKLTSVQDELSNERLLVQRIRSEKAEDGRMIEALRAELAAAQRGAAEAADAQDNLRRDLRRLNDQLEDKDRQISAIRKEEKDRANLLVTAIKSYIDQINSTSS